MQALICSTPFNFRYGEVSSPEPKENHSILKVKRIGICGTDLHAYDGTQPYFSYPRILGHEIAAELVDVGAASDYKKGDEVTIIPYLHCNTCRMCLQGRTNCCTTLKVCGVHIDGAMSEYYQVPSSALVHGDGLPLDMLALIEPMAVGAHAVRIARVKKGEFVIVSGLGPIGLGIVELARLEGATVVALDVNEHRLDFCRQILKADHVVDVKAKDAFEQVREITGGNMADVVFDATGNLKAINNAFSYMGFGARYVLVGLQSKEISFSHPEFHKREGTLMSSRNATRQDFDHVINCIKQKALDPTQFITHRVNFNALADEFPNWCDPTQKAIKPIVEF
jgi:2-desacetyl-2-hydroxyethyl bacteriochlorophyllide A dehydrogenase